jgi:hypothetical protein
MRGSTGSSDRGQRRNNSRVMVRATEVSGRLHRRPPVGVPERNRDALRTPRPGARRFACMRKALRVPTVLSRSERRPWVRSMSQGCGDGWVHARVAFRSAKGRLCILRNTGVAVEHDTLHWRHWAVVTLEPQSCRPDNRAPPIRFSRTRAPNRERHQALIANASTPVVSGFSRVGRSIRAGPLRRNSDAAPPSFLPDRDH